MDDSLDIQQFTWAIQRLARMHGTSVDLLRLSVSVTDLKQSKSPMKALGHVCRRMGWRPPKILILPDRAMVPLICHTDAHGWGLLVDRTPMGSWVLLTEPGPQEVEETALRNRSAILQPRVLADLGFGLGIFRKAAEEAKFFRYVQETLKLYRSELIEACVASFFIGMLAVATSMFSMQVYDRVIPTRSEYTLAILSVGVFLSILFELAMKHSRSDIMDYVAIGLDHRLSREIFHQLLKLRLDQVPSSVGSLAGQLRGYEQVRGFYTASTLFTLIDLPLSLVFILLILVIASPWVAMVPLVFFCASIIIGLSIRKKINEQAKESALLSNLKTGLLVEAVEGIETIKAGSGGWKFLSRWIGVNNQTIQGDLQIRSITEQANFLAATLHQFSYVGLVVAGSLVVMKGEMTMGALIACSILSGRILAPVVAFPGLLVQQAHAQAALDGLERMYQLETDHHGIELPLAPSLIRGHYELTDLKFAYNGNPPAFGLKRLEIQPGERIAVLGPIGAGKSTLLRLLSGLYRPSEGKVLVDGLDLSHISRQVLSEQVGYLQQDHRLFQGTLRENLLIGLPDPGDDAIMDVMRRTGMDRLVAAHPKGLERSIMEGGKGLSGGQKQLVAFTRMILCNYNVLLLDEPTATMDEEQEQRCLQVLGQLMQSGKTMVIVTHKTNVLPLVNRVIVVAGSTVVMDGPRDAVLQALQQRQMQQANAAAAAAVAESKHGNPHA